MPFLGTLTSMTWLWAVIPLSGLAFPVGWGAAVWGMATPARPTPP